MGYIILLLHMRKNNSEGMCTFFTQLSCVKNLKSLNEERSAEKDAAEKEDIRGYPHLESCIGCEM